MQITLCESCFLHSVWMKIFFFFWTSTLAHVVKMRNEQYWLFKMMNLFKYILKWYTTKFMMSSIDAVYLFEENEVETFSHRCTETTWWKGYALHSLWSVNRTSPLGWVPMNASMKKGTAPTSLNKTTHKQIIKKIFEVEIFTCDGFHTLSEHKLIHLILFVRSGFAFELCLFIHIYRL